MTAFSKENIDFSDDVPVIIGIRNMSDVPRHWHNRIEIFLVLSGNLSITVESETYYLSEDDILLVNSNQVHEIMSRENVTVVLQINYSYFKKWLNEAAYFHCNSTVYHNKARFNDLKRIIAQLIYANYNETENNELNTISLAYRLILELMKNYKSNGDHNIPNQHSNSKHLTRLRNIIQYLNENYAEDITLDQLAEKEFLSPSYLSHFFKVNMGVSFFNYLTGIRLNHAVNDLLTTNLTMEQIAANNGFANCRYFVNCFKNKFDVLPKQYRKEQKETQNRSSNPYKGFFMMEQVDYLNKLGEYLNAERPLAASSGTSMTPCKTIETNVLNVRRNLVHTYKTFTGIGRAKEMLFERVRDELRTLQKEAGFHYIKFHGILDDSMMLYNEDADGNPFLTYNYVDEVMDFLLSIGLRPLVQLSFMPKALAKDPTRTVFVNQVILSEPKDNKKWAYMITELTKHFISRYGLEEVRTWMFSFWNVPFQSYIFSFDTNEIAYELYKITRDCVKGCDDQLKFGSPSYGSLNFSGDEYYDFLEYCRENNCYPDFYNIHIYPVKTSTNREFSPSGEISLLYSENDKIILSEDPDYMAHTLDTVRSRLTNFPKLPVYITEWSSTTSHREWLNDTCYRSAYIVKNILENYDDVASFGNWCLTDTMEELPLDNEMFHGEMGLFTYNGIKKPAYYAFTFLNRLMDALIERGDGYFITSNQKGDYAILLYNYIHYVPLYAQGILFNVTFLERYNAFKSPEAREFDFALSNVPDGKYIMTEAIVNREHGSAFDEWVRMGALPLTGEEEINTLKGHSLPKIVKSSIEVSNSQLSYYTELEPHEIRLVLIKKKICEDLPYAAE